MKKIFLLSLIVMLAFKVQSQAVVFQWAKGMGEIASNDEANSSVIDASGNIYITGGYMGTVDFDPGPGIFNLTSTGWCRDIFISKLDASGNFIWARSLGGADCDHGNSIVLDSIGNIYITGTVDLVVSGYTDLFVSKFDSLGNTIWFKTIGIPGISNVEGYSINVDALGNVYTTGYFQTPITFVDFDPGPGVVNLVAPAGFHEIFILKLDSTGNYIWVKQMGGTSIDVGRSIAIDNQGNILIAGNFSGNADFDPSTSSFILTCIGNTNSFVSKLDASGNFLWAKNTGSTFQSACPFSLVLDDFNNIYTTGFYSDTTDFDPGLGIANICSIGGNDIYISKLDSSGNFVWAKSMGGNSINDMGYSINLDSQNNIYTTGYFMGTADFDPGTSTFNLFSADTSGDVFISKLDSDGNFAWAKSVEGADWSYGKSISVDAFDNVYVSGAFRGIVDFDPNTPIANLSSSGNSDIFVLKLSQLLNGIENNSINTQINIFPNPSFGEFNLSNINIGDTIKVYNVMGQLIVESIAKNGIETINLSNEANGIYLIKVISEKLEYHKKIIKE